MRYKRTWHRLWLVYKWGPRALPCSYGFGTLSSRPALTWCTGVTLGQAVEETAPWKSCKKSHWASPESPRRFFWALTLLLCPFLSCYSHACASPCARLMKILILWLDFLTWPQTCLTTVTCLAITGMCWPCLLPPDLLCFAVWLLWDWVSCGGHCPCPLCLGSWLPSESRESKTRSQISIPALLLLAEGWFPAADIF